MTWTGRQIENITFTSGPRSSPANQYSCLPAAQCLTPSNGYEISKTQETSQLVLQKIVSGALPDLSRGQSLQDRLIVGLGTLPTSSNISPLVALRVNLPSIDPISTRLSPAAFGRAS